MDYRNEVIQRTQEVVEDAQKKFNLTFDKVEVRFDLNGTRTIAQACPRDGRTRFILRVHPDVCKTNLPTVLKDIIPHEVAHFVCMKDPSYGRDHNSGWRRVAMILGCTQPRASTRLPNKVPGFTDRMNRKTRYYYVDSAGRNVYATAKKHKFYQERIEYYGVCNLRWDDGVKTQLTNNSYVGKVVFGRDGQVEKQTPPGQKPAAPAKKGAKKTPRPGTKAAKCVELMDQYYGKLHEINLLYKIQQVCGLNSRMAKVYYKSYIKDKEAGLL